MICGILLSKYGCEETSYIVDLVSSVINFSRLVIGLGEFRVWHLGL